MFQPGGGIFEGDDKDGYYKIRPGEVMNSRYQVQSALGKGMFGQGPSLRTFVEKRTASVAAQLAGEREGYVPSGKFGAPGGGKDLDGLGARFVIFRDKVQDEHEGQKPSQPVRVRIGAPQND